ncbi:MAG: hypothetical protein EA405_03065 [Rhodospirillales bacterium]|nr:MAG: hypothetical protein EA405_03065 [Rhodospirillales bacterium]
MNEQQSGRSRQRQPWRLAVTGSAGVGKTTLATHLAQALQVPLIPEGMRARLESGLDLHALGRDGLRDLVCTLFDEAMAHTRAAVTAGEGFVADRCTLDFLAFWLFYGFGTDDTATSRMVDAAAAALVHYDAVVVLPWGAIPLADDGVRTANPWLQLHYQMLLEGLLARRCGSLPLLAMPERVVGVQARADWILDRLVEAP